MTTSTLTIATPNIEQALPGNLFQRRHVGSSFDEIEEYSSANHVSGWLYDESAEEPISEWKNRLETVLYPVLQQSLLGTPSSSVISPLPIADDLSDSLQDLSEAKAEAGEEGFPLPSNAALNNADRLVRELYDITPRRFEIYPTPDGEIAIHALGGRGRSVLLLCDSEEGALCLVNINGEHRRARYSSADILPDGFIREALAELAQQGDRS